MRNMTAIVAGAIALTFAAPALAAPRAEPGKAALKKGKSLLSWLSHRLRVVARRIKKKVGAQRWAQLRKVWSKVVRDRVKKGQGRRMRAFIKFARKFATAARAGKLKRYLKRLRQRRKAKAPRK